MKILFLSHNFSPFIGGIEVISEMLCHGFSVAGHEVRLLTWTEDESHKVFPFQIIRKPSLNKLLQEHLWADIVFENNPCLRLSWPRLFFTRPSIVALHTWVSRSDGKIAFQDRLKLLWLSRASKVIAVSEALRQEVWPKALVIGNPYRAETFKLLSNTSRNKEFVFLGRLVEDKGVDMAIRALSNINRAILNQFGKRSLPTLTIIGEGPYKQKLFELTKELNLELQVNFVGAMRGKTLVKCLNEHRFQLIPSVWKEPFGIVALEGIACGCVPIASDGGGLPDAVGKAGILFKRGEIKSLENAMMTLLTDPTQESKYRKERIDHLRFFQPDNIFSKYKKVVESIKQNIN